MARTYNGRFHLPEEPKPATGWLVAGLILLFTGWSGIGLAASIGCFVAYGRKNEEYKLVHYFREYCAVIGMRNRVSFRELGKVSGTGMGDTQKFLQKMVARGYFGEGAYLDVQRKELVLTPAAAYEPQTQRGGWKDVLYEVMDALRGERIFQDAVREEDFVYEAEFAPEPEPEAAPKPEIKPQKSAKKTYAEELERILNELYQLNVQIADENVSRKIDRIGSLTAGIFRVVIEKPEREQDVRKFMNYYLPTTLKLLRSYDMLEDQGYQSESIVESRRKIEEVLDMLIGAYEKQLDRLFKNDALDIATDIDVLETMMAGDGLSSKGQMPL